MTHYNIISNSSPLIALIKKRELYLLKELFDNIIIHKAVYNELIDISKKLEGEIKILEEAVKNKWITIEEVKNFKLSNLKLGKGEIAVINLCFEINNPLLLIDEKKGRYIAKSFKINTLGTLGILFLAKKKRLRTNKNLFDNLEILIKKDFYLSSEVITKFLMKQSIYLNKCL